MSNEQSSTGSAPMRAGFGRADITGYVHDIGMMGYALPTHRTTGVGAPLHARAVVLSDADGGLTALVCCDLWGITPSLRDGVIARLKTRGLSFAPERLLLTGTHTHSGPGGYSHHLLFNLAISGFVPAVYEAIVAGIVDALAAATTSLEPADVRWSEGEFGEHVPVAFNRSLRAYNRNRDVEHLTRETAARGVDRTMVSLWASRPDGTPLGSFHWFGVHGCSLHSDAGLVHPDNKGLAATDLEAYATAHWNSPDYVAAFPQTTAGDVSPNFRWNRKRQVQVGLGQTDLESAEKNGALQADLARESMASGQTLHSVSQAVFQHVDYRSAPARPEFADGSHVARTGPAVLGVRMMSGTADGAGPPPAWALRPLWWLLNRAVGLRKAIGRSIRRLLGRPAALDIQGPKCTFLQVGLGSEGRLFGLIRQANPPLPDGIDPGLARIKWLHRENAQGSGGWVPQILPLQLIRLGQLAIVGLPFEPTTQTGRRLRAWLERRLSSLGVTRVVIAGWANAYAGYLTTFEEYQAQQYEGASTYFGQWTLAATQTALDDMATALLDGTEGLLPSPEPDRIPADELARRTYIPPGGEKPVDSPS